jgi:hypothetical protein
MTFYGYRPNLAINDSLLTLFSVSMVAYLVQSAVYKNQASFTVVMVIGCFSKSGPVLKAIPRC